MRTHREDRKNSVILNDTGFHFTPKGGNPHNQHERRSMKMGRNDRFEKVYSQGTMSVIEIWVDKETGVNYVFRASGYAGGMTPLLDRDGKPVVTPVVNQ